MSKEKQICEFEKNAIIMRALLTFAFFCALLIQLMIVPEVMPPAREFDRVLGNAQLNGIDATGRNNSILIWYSIALPASLLICCIVIKKMLCAVIHKGFDKNQREAISDLFSISICGVVLAMFRLMSAFLYSTKPKLTADLVVVFIWSSALVIYHYENKRSAYEYVRVSLKCAIATTPVFYIICSIIKLKMRLPALVLWIVGVYVCMRLAMDAVLAHKSKVCRSFSHIVLPIIGIPIVLSLFWEAMNILSRQGIWIPDVRVASIVFISVYVLISSIVLSKMHRRLCTEYLELGINILLLLGLVFIWNQPSYSQKVVVDTFETANHALAVWEFAGYGEIPLIENYDAHMLSQAGPRLLYALVNQDVLGGAFGDFYVGWLNNALAYVLIYSVFASVFDKEKMLQVVLFFPSLFFSQINTYAIGFMACILLIVFIKKKNWKTAVLYWLSLVFICIYRLDIGMAFSVGTVATLATYIFIKRERMMCKTAMFSLCFILSICIAIYFGVCVVHDIQPIDRIIEFLHLGLSNANWAYASIGDLGSWKAVYCYCIIPIASVAFAGIVLVKYVFFGLKQVTTTEKVLCCSLFFAYILNIPRGLTRHSLAELQTGYILSVSALALSIFVGCIKSRIRIQSVAVCFFCITMMELCIQNNPYPKIIESTYEGMVKQIENSLLSENRRTSSSRIDISEVVHQFGTEIATLRMLIPEDETYLDFTNQTVFYALIGREKPVYVNQSPGLLSGEESQKLFIDQIEQYSKSVKYALLPSLHYNLSTNIDGVHNSDRYYLVSEYIAKNYRPVCTTGMFALWVRNGEQVWLPEAEEIKRIDCFNPENAYSYHADLSVKDEHLSVTCIEDGPQVYNFIDLSSLSSTNAKYELIIEMTGNIQSGGCVYYTNNRSEAFSWKKSIRFENEDIQNGRLSVKIPITGETSVCLELNKGDSVEISDAYAFYAIDYQLCDANYGNKDELHVHNMGYIPYLWATGDEKNAIDSPVICETMRTETGYYVFDRSILPEEGGVYAKIDCYVPQNGTASLKLGRYDEQGDFKVSSEYSNIALIEGQNSYLVRVSSDFMWIHGQQNCLQFVSEQDMESVSIQLLQASE